MPADLDLHCLPFSKQTDCLTLEVGMASFYSGLTYGYKEWSGVAKASCIICHGGVQLILAYSWARLAILVAGKGRMFLISSVSSLSFLFLFLSFPLFHLLYYLFSPLLWETTQNDPQGLTCR